MANFFGKDFSAAEILKRVGRIEQIAGLREIILEGGKKERMKAVDINTGTGLSLTVLLSRGMDIGRTFYRGIPLTWFSSSGEVHPSFYESEGLGWLRSFGGGLLVTCGLCHAGAPAEEEKIGLHGRISHIPAELVSLVQKWEKDEFIMEVKGIMRETQVFGENIVLERTISAKGGEKRIFLEDRVRNEGFETVPHMILYHLNLGFPVVDEGSYLFAPVKEVQARDEEAKKGVEEYNLFTKPMPGFKEKCYFLKMQEDAKGKVKVGIINPGLEEGIGVYLQYSKEALPHFVEWKMMGEGVYVVGIEPTNCLLLPRKELHQKGILPELKKGEERVYKIEIGVIEKEEISQFERKIKI